MAAGWQTNQLTGTVTEGDDLTVINVSDGGEQAMTDGVITS